MWVTVFMTCATSYDSYESSVEAAMANQLHVSRSSPTANPAHGS